MIDFPATPTTGQTFDPGTGIVYSYDGVAWNAVTASTATAQRRNRIINPSMQISQELGITSTVTPQAYIVDQWVAQVGGISFSAQKTTATANQIGMQVTTGKALAAGDYLSLIQPIEGFNLADFLYGSASALQSMLRFDVYCPVAGTYGVSIRNGASNRSLVLPFTVSVVNTWTTIVLVIPGDTAGTWVIDNTASMSVSIVFACGTTYSTAISGWQAGNFLAPTGMTNGAATTGNIFYLTNVGLYLDPDKTGLAPKYELPDYGTELEKCQRYWRTIGEAAVGSAWGTASAYLQYSHAPLRITNPTTSIYNAAVTLSRSATQVQPAVSFSSIAAVGAKQSGGYAIMTLSAGSLTNAEPIGIAAGNFLAVNARM